MLKDFENCDTSRYRTRGISPLGHIHSPLVIFKQALSIHSLKLASRFLCTIAGIGILVYLAGEPCLDHNEFPLIVTWFFLNFY